MAEVARIGLSLGGAALFGPIGGVAGGVLGNLLFPPESQSIEGPRAETTVTSSAHGQPMAMVLGTKRVAGQLWDADDIREVKKEEGGGKGGGGPSVTTYEYFGTFMMFIAEVPEKGLTYKVRRVWRNKKLVYDRSVDPGEEETPEDQVDGFADIGSAVDYVSQAKSDVFENYVTFYDGATDQEPDPTLEALHGVGNVPAYRGMAYMVAKDMPLADTGNQIGSYEFEVVLEGTEDLLGQEAIQHKTLYPWQPGPDPRDGRNDHSYGDSLEYDDLDTAIENATSTELDGKDGFLDELELLGWSYESRYLNRGSQVPVASASDLFLHLNYGSPETEIPVVDYVAYISENALPEGFYRQPFIEDGELAHVNWYVAFNPNVGTADAGPPGYRFRTNLADHPDYDANSLLVQLYQSDDVKVRTRRLPVYPTTTCEPPWRVIPEAPEWCINTDTGAVRPNLQFTVAGGDFLTLQEYNPILNPEYTGSEDEDSAVPVYIAANKPMGPTIRENDSRNTQSFWEQAAADAGLDGNYDDQPPVAPENFPHPLLETGVADFDLEAVIANPITLAEALRLIHKRAGITSSQIDTSAFGDKALWGMTIQGGTARSYIEALRTWGWFDWIESDGKLKGVPRGSDPVMTVDAEDLGASTGEPVPRLQQERTEDLELPERVRIRYPSLNAAYQPGQQTSERLVTESRQVVDVDMSVADTDAHAAQAANIVANEQWRARMGRELSLPRQYDRLEPADVFNLTLDGVIYRLRVEEKTYQGAVQLRVVDDEAAEYTSEALAGTVLGGGTLGPLAGPTDIQLLDLPALDDAHDSAGYYIAAWGYTDGWGGCVVQRSTDGGETFANLVTIADAATVAEVISPPSAASPTIIDEAGSIDVRMVSGDLADTNELAFQNGSANAAAIGAHGRWNIVSFRDATLLENGHVRLSYLLQGRKGTEHAIGTTIPGDRLILLTTALERITGNVGDVGQPALFRGATLGTPAANAQSESVTPRGVALRPWAPANIRVTQRDDDLVIEATRRTRLGGGWQGFPLHETDLLFELDVVRPVVGDVLRTLTFDRFRLENPVAFEYTAAQQTEDFGATVSPSEVEFTLYQMSADVGRGYPAGTDADIGAYDPDDPGVVVEYPTPDVGPSPNIYRVAHYLADGHDGDAYVVVPDAQVNVYRATDGGETFSRLVSVEGVFPFPHRHTAATNGASIISLSRDATAQSVGSSPTSRRVVISSQAAAAYEIETPTYWNVLWDSVAGEYVSVNQFRVLTSPAGDDWTDIGRPVFPLLQNGKPPEYYVATPATGFVHAGFKYLLHFDEALFKRNAESMRLLRSTDWLDWEECPGTSLLDEGESWEIFRPLDYAIAGGNIFLLAYGRRVGDGTDLRVIVLSSDDDFTFSVDYYEKPPAGDALPTEIAAVGTSSLVLAGGPNDAITAPGGAAPTGRPGGAGFTVYVSDDLGQSWDTYAIGENNRPYNMRTVGSRIVAQRDTGVGGSGAGTDQPLSRIWWSADGRSWTESTVVPPTFSPPTSRRWRVLFQANGGADAIEMEELQFHEFNVTRDLTDTLPGVPVASTTSQGVVASLFANDSFNQATGWRSEDGDVDGCWVEYQFEAAVSVEAISITVDQTGDPASPTEFTLQYHDGGNWVNAGNWTASWQQADPTTQRFTQ